MFTGSLVFTVLFTHHNITFVGLKCVKCFHRIHKAEILLMMDHEVENSVVGGVFLYEFYLFIYLLFVRV